MAIYSLNHKAIGKGTQERPYTASAHVSYITRTKAMTRLEGARMPVEKTGAMEFLRAGEDKDRKNARVADKIMLALPVELTAEQRAALVRRYAEDITKGRAPWLAAFHDKGKDARNPHCHLIIRDRDPETGRRVIGLSENGSTQRLRETWTVHSNRALEESGRADRIDHRTLVEQGRPGPATIHEGPKGHAIARRGHQPKSQVRSVRNAPQARQKHRNINYPAIDAGQSRGAYNAQAKAMREKEAWEAIDADNRCRELETLRAIHRPDLVGSGRFGFLDDVARRLPPKLQIQQDKLPINVPHQGGVLLSGIGEKELVTKLNFRVALFAPATKWSDQEKRSPDNVDNRLKPHKYRNNHSVIIQTTEDISMGDEIDNVLYRHKLDNERAEYDNNRAQSKKESLMKQAFADPDKAQAKMDRYVRRYGRNALYDMLKDRFDNNKTVHSKKPGSLFTLDGYKTGAAEKRRNADEARHQLPDALRAADEAREKLALAKQTERDARAQYGRPIDAPSTNPSRQGTGLATRPDTTPSRSYSQYLADKQTSSASNPVAAKDQRERELERMRQSREQDKEKGR